MIFLLILHVDFFWFFYWFWWVKNVHVSIEKKGMKSIKSIEKNKESIRFETYWSESIPDAQGINPLHIWNVIYNARSNRSHPPTYQILRLPHKMTAMIDPRHTWNGIYNARSNAGYRPTSPNTAPATKIWVQDLSEKSLNCFRQYKDDSSMIRRQSDHNPTILRPWNAPAASEILLVPSWRRILYGKIQDFYLPKFHEMLRLPRKVTLQLHQICACLLKSLSWLILFTYETSFTMRGATRVTNCTKYCACHEILSSRFQRSIRIDAAQSRVAQTRVAQSRVAQRRVAQQSNSS